MEGFSADFPGFFDGFSANSGFGAILRGGSSSSSLLVLDSERGELVRAPARLGPYEVKAEKAMVALKNHSEAERRRRERINAHLATLRGIIPGTKKVNFVVWLLTSPVLVYVPFPKALQSYMNFVDFFFFFFVLVSGGLDLVLSEIHRPIHFESINMFVKFLWKSTVCKLLFLFL